jgi:hypothetical protein
VGRKPKFDEEAQSSSVQRQVEGLGLQEGEEEEAKVKLLSSVAQAWVSNSNIR